MPVGVLRFSLSYSGSGAKTLLCLPHTQASHGRCLCSPEAAVALASGQKFTQKNSLVANYFFFLFDFIVSVLHFLLLLLFGCWHSGANGLP